MDTNKEIRAFVRTGDWGKLDDSEPVMIAAYDDGGPTLESVALCVGLSLCAALLLAAIVFAAYRSLMKLSKQLWIQRMMQTNERS